MTDPVPPILSSLRLRDEIPPKYFYFGDGAKNWDRYSRDPRYGLGRAEMKLLDRALPEILAALPPGPFHCVDLGPGNGAKAGLILEKAAAGGRPGIYAALDISRDILDIVRRNSRRLFPGLKARYYRIDFEANSIRPVLTGLRKISPRPCLILLLGSGNVTNKPAVLGHIRSAMAGPDRLLISAELRRPGDIGRVLEHYRKRESREVVFFGLKSLGLRPSDGRFFVRFDAEKEQAEVSFVLGRTVAVGRGGRVRLVRGRRILLFTSHKPTAASFRRGLEIAGFSVLKIMSDGPGRRALALCGKDRSR